MKLQYDGIFVKAEKLKTSKNKDYLKITMKEQITNRNDIIFVFDKDLFGKIENLKENSNVIIIFNRFYSFYKKKEVMFVSDVVAC